MEQMTKKEYEKRGNPYKRGSSWTFRYSVEDADGNKKWRTKGGYKTKSEAVAAMKVQIVETEKTKTGLLVQTNMTFSEYLDEWFANYKINLRPSSSYCYEANIKNYIKPSIGDIRLTEVRRSDLQRFVKELKIEGFSGATAKVVMAVVSKAFNDALLSNYIAVNPCFKIKIYKTEPTRKRNALTAEQVKELLH